MAVVWNYPVWEVSNATQIVVVKKFMLLRDGSVYTCSSEIVYNVILVPLELILYMMGEYGW
ncbi:hypothetical protein H5410_036027 [Solanum commersonii]|uniref:Uncharacterized protein n=1 Tax=Solanum commersonii TaxID=4109 RepID=A0A9J5Y2D9_SOLCO|nr:hypothetical protein H5410_036027 [Solanum commersonii]